MKHKFLLAFIVVLFLKSTMFAHTALLQMSDNEDGTMEIFGGFSTGQSAAGAKILIKSQITSNILYENRVPQSGTLIVQIPKEPYLVVLDSGPGHRVEKTGEIEPTNGFNKESLKKPLNLAFSTTLGLSIVFILLSIILGIKNKRLAKR